MIEVIRANGWGQGSIFRPSDHGALQEHARCTLADTDCCIVISQSCDLLCNDFEAEPIAELVLARRLNSPLDGNYTHVRNARRLQFHIEVASAPIGFDARIRDRFSIPRSFLARYQPDPLRRLLQTEHFEVINWILARYDRVAFPDEFNRRIAEVVERKVKRVLKQLTAMKAIYIALNSWDELQAGQDYKISLLGTLSVEDFRDPSTRAAMENGLGRIAAALNFSKGVIVEEADVQSEATVTLDHLRNLARWNFDYISLGSPEQHKLVERK
jgi:hypothetical protein